MKKFLLGCLALLLGMPLAAQTIVIVGDDVYAPMISLNQGTPTGVLVDRMNQVAKELGLTIRFELYPWARALALSKSEDVGIIGISKNAEREAFYDFSRVVYNDSILLIVHKGHEFKFDQVTDLKGKIIGAQIGAVFGQAVDAELLSSAYKFDRDKDRNARLEKLLQDRIDVALIGGGRAGLELVINSSPNLKSHREEFVVLEKPLTSDPLYLAFRKNLNKKDLLEKINKILARMKPD